MIIVITGVLTPYFPFVGGQPAFLVADHYRYVESEVKMRRIYESWRNSRRKQRRALVGEASRSIEVSEVSSSSLSRGFTFLYRGLTLLHRSPASIRLTGTSMDNEIMF